MDRRTSSTSADWLAWRCGAEQALAEELRRRSVLTPRQVARAVARALPPATGRTLLLRLAALGWLRPGARVPFDVFEGPECPTEFRGPIGAIARLAVFGLPGQGRPDFKRRDASYQQICAQIMREASDLPTLSGAASRALSHPDVCGDPGLASMVRAFIAEREAALRTKYQVEHPEPEDDSRLRTAFGEAESAELPTKAQLLATFLRHQKEFEVHLAQYDEAAARYALDQMLTLARRFPVHIAADTVCAHERQFEEFLKRAAAMRAQIEEVARQAVEAARTGDHKTANWLTRRLRAIHALTPVLLPTERFEAISEEIDRSGAVREQHETLRGLIAREREVAAEIKRAAAAIYRFRKVAATALPASDEYKRAEKAYREAVIRVRIRDTEWLTGLLLELDTYIQDLRDPAGRADAQLDRFIGTVRSALNQLRAEINAIQQERAAAEQARALSGQRPPITPTARPPSPPPV